MSFSDSHRFSGSLCFKKFSLALIRLTGRLYFKDLRSELQASNERAWKIRKIFFKRLRHLVTSSSLENLFFH